MTGNIVDTAADYSHRIREGRKPFVVYTGSDLANNKWTTKNAKENFHNTLDNALNNTFLLY